MIKNWYNPIPYPALKTKRETTKYIIDISLRKARAVNRMNRGGRSFSYLKYVTHIISEPKFDEAFIAAGVKNEVELVASEDIRKGSGNGTVKSKDSSQQASGGETRNCSLYWWCSLGHWLELKTLQLEDQTVVAQSCTVRVQRRQSFMQNETWVPVNNSKSCLSQHWGREENGGCGLPSQHKGNGEDGDILWRGWLSKFWWPDDEPEITKL